MSCAEAVTASTGVMVGLNICLCLKNTIPEILVALICLNSQAPSSIMLGGAAAHPPLHGMLSPRLVSVGLLMDEGLRANWEKGECGVVVCPVDVNTGRNV